MTAAAKPLGVYQAEADRVVSSLSLTIPDAAARLRQLIAEGEVSIIDEQKECGQNGNNINKKQ